MYKRILEVLQLCGNKISEIAKKCWDTTKIILDAFTQRLKMDKRFLKLRKFLARFEKRMIQAVVTVGFFVCLYAGAFAAPVNESIIFPEWTGRPEQENVTNEKWPIIEKNPIFHAMQAPDALEDVFSDGSLSDSNVNFKNESDKIKYIELHIEFGSAPSLGTRYVSATCVNFRQEPSLESTVLNKLYRNTEVELLDEGENGFSVVRYNGQIGYMYTEYLSETKIKVETTPQYSYGYITNLRERVAAIAKNNQGTQPCIGGYCAKWVSGIYQAAGCGYPGGHAIDYWLRWGATGSTSLDNIPVGAVVVGSGSGSELGNQYGHVGIYIGDGLVADNVGYHRIISLWEWVSYNVGVCHGYQGYIGWVWPYGQPIPE